MVDQPIKIIMKKRFSNINSFKLKAALFLLAISISSCIFSQDNVADNMLVFQRSYGGWPKHFHEKAIDYNRQYSAEEKAFIKADSAHNDATIDNNATTKEIRYLLKAYKDQHNPQYMMAVEKGIRYLLKAQYSNGGWPQYYPDKSLYRAQVTYNDNAMVNVLNLLMDIAEKKNNTEVVEASFVPLARQAVDKGIACILKTQIKVNGKPTAWCAQYNERSLKPETARKFELASISGMESVGIVQFLMRQPNPSKEITDAINSAMDWFKVVAIVGYNVVEIADPSQPKGKDKVLVSSPNSIIWARFYDLDSNEPFFCGRDGIKRKALKDIEVERRTGYAWYGTWPQKLLDKQYPEWKQKHS
jgi:PelA/Pel-15E family pectate lyase